MHWASRCIPKTKNKKRASSLTGDAPSLGAVHAANAKLLKKAPSETCLESVSRSQVDARGKVHKDEMLRAGWAPFYAELITLGVRGDGYIDRREMQAPAESAETSEFQPMQVPGVASITFANPGVCLPTGTQMVWKAQSLMTATGASKTPEMATKIGLR